jgi:hypothetical protein
MIQRIQSLWLLLAAAALIAIVFLPVGMFKMPHGFYECTAFLMTQAGDVEPMKIPVWFIGALSIFGAALSLLSIFMFKGRKLQQKVVWFALVVKLVLLLGMVGLFVYFKKYMDSWVGYGPAVWMPLLGIVMDFFAIKAIKKDDALVKSLDRIR